MNKMSQNAINKAQDLIYDAWENNSAVQRKRLAQKALSIDPLCADAYHLLAEEADSLSQEIDYCQKGIQAFEDRFDETFFVQNKGHFWGLIETRPYIRLLSSLGEALWASGKEQQAIEQYESILRLNEMDNLGVRYLLITWLLIQKELDKADTLIKRYPEDSAFMLFSELYLLIADGADKKKINALWQRANEANPYVIDYLTFHKTMPEEMPEFYQIGEETEAIYYFSMAYELWLQDRQIMSQLKQVAGK